MSTWPDPTFGALLRQARRAAGFTQKELAERAHISVDAISVLERGLTRAPHQDTLHLLAEALQLAPAERVQWEQATRGMRLPGSVPEQSDSLSQAIACPLPGSKRQLPIPATPLIGREQEVQAICAQLRRPEVHLLTVTGSAGVGKTRLALQVAAGLAETFADGAQFVSLAALNDPALVLPTLAQALGVRESGALPVLTLLATALCQQQMLLVLDNFEHVIAAAPHLAALLEACPGVKILVTSREVLRLRAEQQFVAPPLALPRRDAPQHMDSTALEENPAVRLFLQRAQAIQPDFHLTPDNAATIAEICHRLEGIPLAIELAAPRLKLLSPQALLARMGERLHMLTGGARDLPERQRTMRATIAWSYELLSPDERALFRRLAVFMGEWTLEAAERVCLAAGTMKLGMLEGLSSLLDKSLVSQEPASNGETRFKMLYVLREFGLEQLGIEGEEATTREAHAAYYLALAEAAHPQLQGTEQQGWRNRLKQEHDNLRAALDWWLGHAEQAHAPEAAERALRLWWSMSPFWLASCYREGYANVKRVLAVRASVAEAVQVKALLYAASVLRAVDEVEQAEMLAQEALALARQTEDLPGIAFALQHLNTQERGDD